MQNKSFRMAALSGIAAALVASNAMAQQWDNRIDSEGYGAIPPVNMPVEHSTGEVNFITGGIGDEEREALNAVKSDYNLHILSASKSGAFTAGMNIVITNSAGQQVLNTSGGPIFYADMPPGRYTVMASRGDETKKQTVNITRGKASRVTLSWL